MLMEHDRHVAVDGAPSVVSPLVKVPYVDGMLLEETRAWAEEHGADLCELDGRQEAYHEALCQWWSLDGDLVIVEQDVVPGPDTIRTMLTCDFSEWCVGEYWISVKTDDGPRTPISSDNAVLFGMGLGCTKFSHKLRHDHPELGPLAGEPIVFGPEPDPDPPNCWWVMDMRLAFRLLRLGYLPHTHGEVIHLR